MLYLIKNILFKPYWKFKRRLKDRTRQNSIMIYDPGYISDAQIVEWEMPLTRGERVIYLFEIVNMTGHCAVVNSEGKVIWGMHVGDFRVPLDNEI